MDCVYWTTLRSQAISVIAYHHTKVTTVSLIQLFVFLVQTCVETMALVLCYKIEFNVYAMMAGLALGKY